MHFQIVFNHYLNRRFATHDLSIGLPSGQVALFLSHLFSHIMKQRVIVRSESLYAVLTSKRRDSVCTLYMCHDLSSSI